MLLLFASFVLVLSGTSYVKCVSDSGEESFKDCLIAKPSEGLGYCLGVGTLNKLQTLENDPDFGLVDGVRLYKDEQQYRESYNFVATSDPRSLRSIVDSIEQIFSKRNMLLDMSFLYPGLSMRLAPSFDTGGVLDFALDERREAINRQQRLQEVGAARVLARQYLVPLLLGFKFNLASLVPIIFGVVALLASKAAIISKLALVLTSAYALSQIVFQKNQNSCSQNHYQPTLNPAFGGNYDFRYKNEDYKEKYLNGKNNLVDQLQIHGSIPVEEVYTREDKESGRNFAWSEDEFKKKT